MVIYSSSGSLISHCTLLLPDIAVESASYLKHRGSFLKRIGGKQTRKKKTPPTSLPQATRRANPVPPEVSPSSDLPPSRQIGGGDDGFTLVLRAARGVVVRGSGMSSFFKSDDAQIWCD